MTRYPGKLFPVCILIFFLTAIPAFAADTDGDGLTDDVEARLGSNSRHKDIFVYINSFIWKGKNMRPRGNFVTIAKAVFSTAPVSNPDGTTGINLHIEMGPQIRTNIVISTWTEFDVFKDQYLPASKRSTHHYCLFVGEINIGGDVSHSGVSRNGAVFRQGASDFMVSLGHPEWFNSPSPAEFKWTQAGTFVHELGHNLGLTHGGSDFLTYKPNHLSIMSYAYQTDGIPITVPGKGYFYLYDYGSFAPPKLNENNLNENVGMGQGVVYQGTIYGARWWVTYSGRVGKEVFDASSSVDWNDDGRLQSGVRFNLNLGDDTKYTVLRGGVNEWARLYYRGGQIAKASIQSKSLMPSEFLYPCMKVSDRPITPLAAIQNIPRITFHDLLEMRKR
jgi:hypothetical protein